MDDPLLGEQKKGDLAFLRVYKFKMVKQLTLLGYSYEDGTVILELIALGSHENFYRDVKKLFWPIAYNNLMYRKNPLCKVETIRISLMSVLKLLS